MTTQKRKHPSASSASTSSPTSVAAKQRQKKRHSRVNTRLEDVGNGGFKALTFPLALPGSKVQGERTVYIRQHVSKKADDEFPAKRTLFVTNIRKEWSSEVLMFVFSSCGGIVSVSFKTLGNVRNSSTQPPAGGGFASLPFSTTALVSYVTAHTQAAEETSEISVGDKLEELGFVNIGTTVAYLIFEDESGVCNALSPAHWASHAFETDPIAEASLMPCYQSNCFQASPCLLTVH